MADPMNSVVIHLICSSGFYGAERVVANLIQAFPEFQMQVLCMARESSDLTTFMAQVRKSPTSKFQRIGNKLLPALKELRSLQRNNPTMIIHAHGYKEILVATLFKLLFRTPVIVTQHGFTNRNFKSKVYNWIDKACCRWGGVDTLIAVSEQSAAIYQQFGVADNKIIVLHNGIASGEKLNSASLKKAFTSQQGIPADNQLILFAGRLSAEKDPILFVKAIAAMRRNNSQITGIIAGDGPLSSQVRDTIRTLHLESHVKCLGFVSNIDQLIPAASILMLTSQSEGIPMVMLEAMAAGTPVVAAAVGGIPTVMTSGYNGVLVDSRQPEDFAAKALELLANEETRLQLIRNGITTIHEGYSLKSQQATYHSIYQTGSRQEPLRW